MEIYYSDNVTPVTFRRKRRYYVLRWLVALILLILLAAAAGAVYVQNLTQPPFAFPVGEMIEIPEGTGVKEITELLEHTNIVRSADMLFAIIAFMHDPTMVRAGTYKFNERVDAFEVAQRIVTGSTGIEHIRFVHYEGDSVAKLAESAARNFTYIDAATFTKLAAGYEGKLYPDTYLIPETFTEEDLIDHLRNNYEAKIAPLRPTIQSSNFTEQEVLIIASLLEREANSDTSMKLVAGIIENRLAAGMPLQLDASVEYTLDKPLSELTPNDLREDTPYNTYTNLGLPPTPIGNPGITAIDAVLRPTPSNYYFYITGNDGNFYYAETYEEHNRNIARYLR